MAGFLRVASAPAAPGALEDSGFCRQPGHGNFEANKYCKACDTRFCIKCTALHIGHENGDAGGFDRVVSAPSVNPQVSAERSKFDDQMAQFRRTSSASSQAAARAIALANGLRRRLSTSITSSDKTISSAKSTLKEAGEAILKWFAGLSGQALDAAILKSFHQFDLDGTGLLDRDEFAKAMHAMGLRLTPEELKELFDSYDVDGNGTIDTKEFAQMVRKHLGKKEAEASSTHNGSAVNSIQNWHSDDSTHSPAAAVLQKWARAALARVKQTHVRRSAISIQKSLRGMRDRKFTKRLRIQTDENGRYTELDLTVEELLASIPLLCKVPTHLRHLLAKNVVYRSFCAKDLIVAEGEPADSMLVLISGSSKVVRGRERKEVMRLKAGNFFGENSLFQTGETRHASVIAAEEVTCLEIRRDVYLQVMGGCGPMINTGAGGAFLYKAGDTAEGRFSRTGSAAEIVATSLETASHAPEVPPVPGYLKAQNRQHSAVRTRAASASGRRETGAQDASQDLQEDTTDGWELSRAASREPTQHSNAQGMIIPTTLTSKASKFSYDVPPPRTRSAEHAPQHARVTDVVRPLDLRSIAPVSAHACEHYDMVQPLAPNSCCIGFKARPSGRPDLSTTLPRRQPATSREQDRAPKSARTEAQPRGISQAQALTRSSSSPGDGCIRPCTSEDQLSIPPSEFPPSHGFLGPRARTRLPRGSQNARNNGDAKARSGHEPWTRASDATRVNGWVGDSRAKGETSLWSTANAIMDNYQGDSRAEAAGQHAGARSVDKASTRHGSSLPAPAALRTTPRGSTSSRAKLFFGNPKAIVVSESTRGSRDGAAAFTQSDFQRATSVPGRRPKKAFIIEQVDLRS